MSLELVYRGETNVPVEIEGFTPDWACDKPLAEIEKYTIFHGNRRLPLAEMFGVSGDAADKQFHFEGDLWGVHWIGAGMTSGQIHIHGRAGRHLGSEMAGGQIVVDGDAQDWAGAEMHGGRLRIRGSAGHQVGAAYRGSAKGMTGGTILVHRDAGDEIGHSMRRGTIAVGGAAGDAIGYSMIAGTVMVFGKSGRRAGAGMRRGTIGLFGPHPAALLPSFRYGATYRPDVVRLMLQSLRDQEFPLDDSLWSAPLDIYHGDLLESGRGEILLRAAA
jgi:formylmethanofuran dehydrogenase subunit C